MGLADDLGKGVGGLFRNPGVLALAALGIGLFIFRKPIQEAFANLGGQIGGLFSPSGIIQGAGEQAGQFVFNIGQDVGGAVFGAGQQAGEAVFGAGVATGDFFGKLQRDIDQQLQNFFRTAPSDLAIGAQNIGFDLTQTAQKAAEEGGPLTGLFDFFSGLFPKGPISPADLLDFSPVDPALTAPFTGKLLNDAERFAQDFPEDFIPNDIFFEAKRLGITPQELFRQQERSGAEEFTRIAAIPTFGEVLAENPQLTASQIANLKFIQAGGGEGFDFGTNTGLALELAGADFGSTVFLQREDPSFALLQEAEALRSMATLGSGSGGLFANPEFPITLGESFLGKSGTVVSQSISNLNEMQLKDFIEQFG